jgi:hypothetical protein
MGRFLLDRLCTEHVVDVTFMVRNKWFVLTCANSLWTHKGACTQKQSATARSHRATPTQQCVHARITSWRAVKKSYNEINLILLLIELYTMTLDMSRSLIIWKWGTFSNLHTYITYHSRFIPKGEAEASQMFLRDAHVLPKLFIYEEYCERVR